MVMDQLLLNKCPMRIRVQGRKWRNRAVLIRMKPLNQKLCVRTGIAQQRPFLLKGQRHRLCMDETPDSWADVTQNITKQQPTFTVTAQLYDSLKVHFNLVFCFKLKITSQNIRWLLFLLLLLNKTPPHNSAILLWHCVSSVHCNRMQL